MTTTAITAGAPMQALENSYLDLPPAFYARIEPTPVAAPRLLRLNRALAEQLGLDPEALASEAGVALLAGNQVPAGAEPLAMAYAGHQFGQFVPSLGDGRAILLGERIDRDGQRRDIQLKGAGRTPFSRSGDGRAVLGPVLREYILGEAMAGLGIPTTRALAMVASGEEVFREAIEQGAVLTRVAASHVRVGTFEYFARRGDVDAVRRLADYVMQRHYPECRDAEDPYQALLAMIASRQGDLIARWMLVGFIHGVMNTDNMAISGETIDYGPCAFIDGYHPGTRSTAPSTAAVATPTTSNRALVCGIWPSSRIAYCRCSATTAKTANWRCSALAPRSTATETTSRPVMPRVCAPRSA
jgi:uncharacterized protein YdiU (UPF0061 family)